MRMRTFVAGQEAYDDSEFAELALGTPVELWLGVEGESPEERAARLDAARDILNDDPELFDRVTRLVAEMVETNAPELLNVTALPRLDETARRVRRAGVAA